jgi:hypothetical protein
MAYLGYDMDEGVLRRRKEQAMRGQAPTSDMDQMRRFTAGTGPMPTDWSPGQGEYGSAPPVGKTPMTAEQAQMIRDAENRPTARDVLTAGQKGNWIENQADVNQTTAELGGMFIGEGYNDRPTWTEESRLAGEALNRGLAKGREQKAAMDARDFEIEKMRATAMFPKDAELYARYKRGEIAGYEITSNPNVSPFWKRMVAEEPAEPLDPSRYGRAQLPGNSSRQGMSPTMLRSESMQQMTRFANRLAEGRGGLGVRTALSNYQAALAGGDQTQINAAQAELEQMLGPMFDKFQSRFDKEAGEGVGDLKKTFMDQLRGRLMSGTAGVGYRGGGMPMQSPTASGQDPRSRGSSVPGASSSVGGGRVSTSPQGLRITEFDSRTQAIEAIRKGDANLSPGSIVRIGGDVMTATPTGTGEFAFLPAMLFGSTAVPHPSAFNDGNRWTDSLSDEQRQAMLQAMAVDPKVRGAIPRKAREELDRLRESRFGLLNQSMSPRDRSASVATLRAEEDALLNAVVRSSLSEVGRSNAMTESSMAMTQAGQDDAEASIGRRGESEDKRSDAAMSEIRDQAPIGDMSTDEYEAAGDLGGEIQANPTVDRLWTSLGDAERDAMNDIIATASLLPEEEGVQRMSGFTNEELVRLMRMMKSGAAKRDPARFVAEIEMMSPGFTKEHVGNDPKLSDAIEKSREMFQKRFDNVMGSGGEISREAAVPLLSEMYHQLIVGGGLGRLSADRSGQNMSEQDLYQMVLRDKMTQQQFVNYMLANMGGEGTPQGEATVPAGGPTATVAASGQGAEQAALKELASRPTSDERREAIKGALGDDARAPRVSPKQLAEDKRIRDARYRLENPPEPTKPSPYRVVPGPPRGHSFSPGGGQSRVGNNPRP